MSRASAPGATATTARATRSCPNVHGATSSRSARQCWSQAAQRRLVEARRRRTPWAPTAGRGRARRRRRRRGRRAPTTWRSSSAAGGGIGQHDEGAPPSPVSAASSRARWPAAAAADAVGGGERRRWAGWAWRATGASRRAPRVEGGEPRAAAWIPLSSLRAGRGERGAASSAQAAAGDQAAWDQLVDGFSGLVWSVVRGHGLYGAEAADICQTVWLRFVEHLASHPRARAGRARGWPRPPATSACGCCAAGAARVAMADTPEAARRHRRGRPGRDGRGGRGPRAADGGPRRRVGAVPDAPAAADRRPAAVLRRDLGRPRHAQGQHRPDPPALPRPPPSGRSTTSRVVGTSSANVVSAARGGGS